MVTAKRKPKQLGQILLEQGLLRALALIGEAPAEPLPGFL